MNDLELKTIQANEVMSDKCMLHLPERTEIPNNLSWPRTNDPGLRDLVVN